MSHVRLLAPSPFKFEVGPASTDRVQHGVATSGCAIQAEIQCEYL